MMIKEIEYEERRIEAEMRILREAGYNPKVDTERCKGFVSAHQADLILAQHRKLTTNEHEKRKAIRCQTID